MDAFGNRNRIDLNTPSAKFQADTNGRLRNQLNQPPPKLFELLSQDMANRAASSTPSPSNNVDSEMHDSLSQPTQRKQLKHPE